MNIKQLSVLLLALSIAADQSVNAVDKEKEEKAKKSKMLQRNTKQAAKKQDKNKKSTKTKKAFKVKKYKKARGKRPSKVKKSRIANKTVIEIGKIDRSGDIKKFTQTANDLIEFMNVNSTTATPIQKEELWAILVRFNGITGKWNRFASTAHYATTEKLLEAANKHSNLFGPGKGKINLLKKWLAIKKEQVSDHSKRAKIEKPKHEKAQAEKSEKTKKAIAKKSAEVKK